MDDVRQLERVERRALHYWVEDGLPELFLSVVFLGPGLYFLAGEAWPGRLPGVVRNLVFPAVVLVLALGAGVLLRRAKDRYVHPRTGYVNMRRPLPLWPTMVLCALLAVLVIPLFLPLNPLARWVPAGLGLVFGLVLVAGGRRTGLLRLGIEGVATAVLGVTLSLVRLDDRLAAALLFTGIGALLVAGGLVGLVAYLRHAPPVEQS